MGVAPPIKCTYWVQHADVKAAKTRAASRILEEVKPGSLLLADD